MRSIRECALRIVAAATLASCALQVRGQVFQELYSFTGGADGANPEGALIQARDGNLYGTTTYGPGLIGYGTVFKITQEGALTTLAAFAGTNGAFPYGALVEASDGNLYGTTLSGLRGAPTFFRITPEGQLTMLARFIGGLDNLAGTSPLGELVQGPDGKLYGVATYGGDYNSAGTVFRVSTNGEVENLHFFYGDDGRYPSGGLLLASDGNFYGVTGAGGVCTGDGTIFRLTTNGTVTTVASFCQGVGNAVWPVGKLLQASDGNFYGAAGGGVGTIFKCTVSGVLATFDRFIGYDGEDPVGGLIEANDGYVYGTAFDGGDYPNHGTVFRLALGSACSNHVWEPCGNLSLVFQLGIENSGLHPYAGLTKGKDGNLYGTTAFGGASGGGNIFRIMTGNECSLTCPTNISVCNDPGQCGAVVHFDPPLTTNCSGFVLTTAPPSGSFFPVGTNTVVCTAIDSSSGRLTNTCNFLVTVRDCEPPVIHSITATPASLWPPNHKMQPVTLSVNATDNCRVARSKIISVVSNEPAASDWEITGDLALNLRAERSLIGAARIYTITVECADAAGNRSTAVARVTVQH